MWDEVQNLEQICNAYTQELVEAMNHKPILYLQ
jgi:hypothetical protein